MIGVPVSAIVDDEDSVRRSLLRVVRWAGYAAESFPSVGHLRKPCGEQAVLDAIHRAVRVSEAPLAERDGAARSRTRLTPNDGNLP